jgi:LmbE family N-acetylglucosaminyl deacetylase
MTMRAIGLLQGALSGGTVLCIGAHSDDIEIGSGGTIRKLLRLNPDVTVNWVVLGAQGVREQEARASARQLLDGAKGEIIVKPFRDGFFPYIGAEVKEFFESLKSLPTPDLILTHTLRDLHQDHRITAELTWNTFRDHLILEYEIPKFDGDLGSPNVFVSLTEEEVTGKLELLERCFPSQHDKPWFSHETFRAVCRLRGVECNSPSGFAEGFYARKLVVG